ncbi:hypothetical protein H310_09753 [Aphanomyces invadans]|uniref:Uncharacterized protein n=1 Tax=Aphanomyces invadans TaxID=157072 RepID=A0A024TVT1_9STRA|nr:hypothetical protein H310_09752 [Aphanomyces invadans]XP_008874131.1 hypothetical protein H310_09753 [Aphanomyces invadans]ETV97422.1 hypothetical protein H310_09752 [Aphanomyces invadans]ETV97423.1 hypothetical protein H310_09753 [Aphanomyces invadans]|eukprot:XP_008874130.1 hypothetical protein H310_09752 [Aphanomyces invadans]
MDDEDEWFENVMDDGDDMMALSHILFNPIPYMFSSDESSSSDDDDERILRGGSSVGRCRNKPRDHRMGLERLYRDYFSFSPVYDSADFRSRIPMRMVVFQRVHDGVLRADPYFTQRADACGVLRLDTYQKVTTALRMLANGCAADALDENMTMAESTTLESLSRFCRALNDTFGDIYLRAPTVEDLERICTTNGVLQARYQIIDKPCK